MITKQTAWDLWCAYDEVEKGEKLIRELREQVARGEAANLRDAFGRPRNLQLGVPSGESAHRLLDVHPNLAVAIIQAHVAEKRSVLAALNEQARAEAGEVTP